MRMGGASVCVAMASLLSRPIPRVYFPAAFLGGLLAVFWVYHPLVLLQWDFGVYYLAAQAYEAGLSFYDPAALQEIASQRGLAYHGLPFLYPPWCVLFFLPLAQYDLYTAAFLWLAVKCVLLQMSVFAILLLLQRRVTWSAWLVMQGLVMFYRPVGLDLSAGNVTLAESSLLLAGLLGYRYGRHRLLGIAIGLAGCFKYFPWLLGFYARYRDEQSVVKGGVFFMAGLLLASAMMGGRVLEYIAFTQSDVWAHHWDEQVQSVYNNSLVTWVLRTFSETYFYQPLWHSPTLTMILAPGLPLLVLLSALFKIRQLGPNVTLAPVIALLILALMLVSPRMTGYSLVWTLFPLCFAVQEAWRKRHWLAGALIGAAAGLIQWYYPPSRIQPGWEQLLLDKPLYAVIALYLACFLLLKPHSGAAAVSPEPGSSLNSEEAAQEKT